MDKLQVALEALKEIRTTQKDCGGCKGDCMWCHDGTGHIFNTADKAIKEIEKDIPAMDLKNRVFEINIRTWLPQFLESSDVRIRWDEACLKAKQCSELLFNLFGNGDCSMEVKAGPKNPCPEHPYNEKEGCLKCLQKNQP